MAYLYKTLRLIFDAIICDLPYGTTACAWDTIIPFEPLWENYKRLVKSNGAVVLFGSQPFTSKGFGIRYQKLIYLMRKINLSKGTKIYYCFQVGPPQIVAIKR
jgi:tRNA G10  N-methylase Trm11